MTDLLVLLLVLILLFALSGIAGHLDSRVRKHGPHALAWRWCSGEAWHGRAITNRGWSRPGTKALTTTGYAHRRYYWPRWQHAFWRIRWTLVTLLTAAGLLLQSRRTAEYLGVTAAAGAGLGAWRARSWLGEYSHRKNYVKPLHVRLAADAGIPLANKPESWLEVPRDLSYARLTWPRGAQLPKPQEQRAIESTAASTLGMKGAKPSWQFTGPKLILRLVPPVPAPRWVFLDRIEWSGKVPSGDWEDVIRRAMREADVDELVLGVGQEGKIIKISLRLDSPHIAVSVDTGGGKSVLVRCLVSQVLLRGGIVAILDNKLVSHPSLRALPNVAYADDIDKIHDFLVWLDGELTTRAQFIKAHTDFDGNLTGNPGARLFVIMEEQNLMMNRLRSYWAERIAEDRALRREDRENLPAVSPAVRGFENASYVGRELKVHLVFISQRFTAEAAGGGSKGAAVRMNTGIRLLAGYDDDTWKMLVGKTIPMPSPSKHAGRMQLYVKGGDVTEVQVAFFTHAETRQFAQSSPARVPAKLRHLTTSAPATPAGPVTLLTWPEESRDAPAAPVTVIPQLPPPVHNWMTIRQEKEAGMLPRTWKNPSGAFGTLKNRAKKEGRPVPDVKGWQGTRAMYDAVELADFLEREIGPT